MTDAATFWDKAAPKYAQDSIKDMAAYEYTLEWTKSYLGANDRVLEMGCGTGSTALPLAPHVRDIIGTDLSPAMVDIARAKADAGRIKNASFWVATASESAKLSDPVNAVLGFNLFHLVRGAEDIFADVYKMLPKGGYFITKTPCLGDRSFGFERHPIKLAVAVMQMFGKAPYVCFLTQKELENALEFAGFEIVEAGNFLSILRYVVAKRA